MPGLSAIAAAGLGLLVLSAIGRGGRPAAPPPQARDLLARPGLDRLNAARLEATAPAVAQRLEALGFELPKPPNPLREELRGERAKERRVLEAYKRAAGRSELPADPLAPLCPVAASHLRFIAYDKDLAVALPATRYTMGRRMFLAPGAGGYQSRVPKDWRDPRSILCELDADGAKLELLVNGWGGVGGLNTPVGTYNVGSSLYDKQTRTASVELEPITVAEFLGLVSYIAPDDLRWLLNEYDGTRNDHRTRWAAIHKGAHGALRDDWTRVLGFNEVRYHQQLVELYQSRECDPSKGGGTDGDVTTCGPQEGLAWFSWLVVQPTAIFLQAYGGG